MSLQFNAAGLIETTGGVKRLRTTGASSPSGSILDGISWDEVQASYPNAVTEVYEFYLTAALVATVTVVYTNSSKQLLLSATRT